MESMTNAEITREAHWLTVAREAAKHDSPINIVFLRAALDEIDALRAALDAKDAERDRYRVVLEEIARDERLAGTEWAKAARTALKGKSGVLIADDDSPAVYQPMNLSGEAVGGRVVVPAKEKCEECNGSGTSCTGGNCCMTCSECNGTGTA